MHTRLVIMVALMLSLAAMLVACAADINPIAELDDWPDAGNDSPADAPEPSDAAAQPDTLQQAADGLPGLDTAIAADSLAPAPDTAPTATDTARGDTAPACAHDGGVPAGYFCARNEDCCSGRCGGPDKRCLSE